MESKDELKQIDIKNRTYSCYGDITEDVDTYFSDILYDEKLYENISLYGISYKTPMGSKALRIGLDKINEIIRVRVGEFKYLVLFDHGFPDKTRDKYKYVISEKSNITDGINLNFEKIGNYLYNSLLIAKILTFHNFIILIQSVVNKNKNNYYYNMFIEIGSYNDKFDTRYN